MPPLLVPGEPAFAGRASLADLAEADAADTFDNAAPSRKSATSWSPELGRPSPAPPAAWLHPRDISPEKSMFFWLLVTVPLVIASAFPFALLPNQFCDVDSLVRNYRWFDFFWDNLYNHGMGVALVFAPGEIFLVGPVLSHFSNFDRLCIYVPMYVVQVGISILLKFTWEKTGLYQTKWAWPLYRLNIVISCPIAYCCLLFYVMRRLKDHRLHWFGKWFRGLLILVWGLVLFYFNQFYVLLYVMGSNRIQDGPYAKFCSVYDFFAAAFFIGCCQPSFMILRDIIARGLRVGASQMHQDRMRAGFVFWSEAFSACFGRVIFGNVSSMGILILLLVKDQLGHIMELAFVYQPRRMISMALRESNSAHKACMSWLTLFSYMLLEIDLETYEELLLCNARHTTSVTGGELVDLLLRQSSLAVSDGECSEIEDTCRLEEMLRQSNAEVDFTWFNMDEFLEREAEYNDPERTIRTGRHFNFGRIFAEVKGRTFGDRLRPVRSNTRVTFLTNSSHHSSVRSSFFDDAEQRSLKLLAVEEQTMPRHSFFVENPEVGVTLQDLGNIIDSLTATEKGYSSIDRPDEHDLARLALRMIIVQKNIRIRTIATYVPHLVSSFCGLTFLLIRNYFPCTLSAYGISVQQTFQQRFTWCYLFIGDILELFIILYIQAHSRIVEPERNSWKYLENLMWFPPFILAAAAIVTHIVEDTYLARYILAF